MNLATKTLDNMGFAAHFVCPNALHFAKPENVSRHAHHELPNKIPRLSIEGLTL